MTNVWAYRTQDLPVSFTKAGEWDHVIEFDTLSDLLDKLKKAGISQGQVRKLGIVAHGDQDGRVQMKPVDLTKSTLGQLDGDLKALSHRLWKNARVIFYSCIAARGPEGSALLNELSGKYFPERHVIGFEKWGALNDGEQPAGEVRCSENSLDGRIRPEYYCNPTATLKTVTDVRRYAEQFLSEYAIYAKWSYKGKIIKLPLGELIQHKFSIPVIICGPDAVLQALKDPAKREKIEYIAINTKDPSDKLLDLFTRAQEREMGGFTWNRSPIPKRMREISEVERRLAAKQHQHLPKHNEVVAVCEQKLTSMFKCAWVSCPGRHEKFEDYCKGGVEHIPNGPMK